MDHKSDITGEQTPAQVHHVLPIEPGKATNCMKAIENRAAPETGS